MIMCVLTMILALTAPTQASDPDDYDLDAVREAIARSWESIQTLHFRSEEMCWDPNGKFSNHMSINYFLDDDDRRVVEIDSYALVGDGRNSHHTYIEDGVKFALASSRTKDRSSIFQLWLRDQTSSRGNLDTGAGCAALMLWTPVRRPLHEHLEAGGRLEVDQAPDGRERICLVAEGQFGQAFRCELDPEHDFLPRRVSYGGVEWEATGFRQAGGRWFPSHGRMIDSRVDRERRIAEITFVVTELHINRPIPEETFELPELSADGRIVDERGRTP